MLAKHNDLMTANMCISVVWVEKNQKKSRPTDLFFFRHVTVNTTFFFLPQCSPLSDTFDLQSLRHTRVANSGQLGLGSSRPESTWPGQTGLFP